MNIIFRAILVGAFVGLVAGCSPTSDAENSLRQTIVSESGGRLSLVSFKKYNGQASEEAGIKEYSLTYEAKIRMEEDGIWLRGSDDTGFGFTTPQAAQGTWGDFGTMVNHGVALHKGQIATISGGMFGSKTEQGWAFTVNTVRLIVVLK